MSEGKKKRKSNGKTQSSKSQEASSNSSDEDGQDHSSEKEFSLSLTASASMTANSKDIEDVKREAFSMVWSADLADEMPKRFKQPKRIWDEASSWAELTAGGDTEYASRLRYSYLNAFLRARHRPDKR